MDEDTIITNIFRINGELSLAPKLIHKVSLFRKKKLRQVFYLEICPLLFINSINGPTRF